MKIPKKRCTFCHCWYDPDPRTWKHQLACSKAACRKLRHAQADRAWRIKHPKRDNAWKLKVQAWARNYPYYWRQYRSNHPDYCQQDNQRRIASASRASAFRKTDAIRQISLEKIRSIREMSAISSAKTDAIDRRVEAIVEYLQWAVEPDLPQTTDAMAFPAGTG